MVVGNIETMEYADGFSIKHSYITADMVNKVHKKGKKIYAWTLNNEEAVKKILLLDVDSIITDDPYWAKNLMYNANSTLISDWIDRLIHEY